MGASRPQRRLLSASIAALAAALLACALTAASASALTSIPFQGSFCEPTGIATAPCEPAFQKPTGLAVDPVTGDLLVIDSEAKTLSRWHSDGTPSDFSALGANVIDGKLGPEAKPCGEEPASCDATPEGELVFGEGREVQVAIDDSGTATDGNIYLTQVTKHVVDIFAPSGAYIGQLTHFLDTNSEAVALQKPCGVAVDENGAIYVAERGGGGTYSGIHQYVPASNPPTTEDNARNYLGLLGPCTTATGAGPTAGAVFASRWDRLWVSKLDLLTGAVPCALSNGNLSMPAKPIATAVSGNPINGHLFVARGFATPEVVEYDGSCPLDPEHEDGELLSLAVPASPPEGVAYDPATAHLYVTRRESSQVEVFGEPVDLPVATTGAADAVEQTTATLTGTVDPTGSLLFSCDFSYLTEAAYQANLSVEAEPFAGAETQACAETPAAIGEGEEPVPVHADLTGLAEGVKYRYRLSAENAGGTDTGATKSFATRAPPQIAETWLADATYNGATVKAKINPRYYPTTFHLDYGSTETYGESSTELSAGTADGTLRTLTAELTGLEPGTAYHFKLIASNENGSAESADATLTTYRRAGQDTCPNAALRAGPGAALPNCRGYEMVSPLDKGGGDIAAAESPGGGGTSGFYQAATEGDGITYTSATAFGDAVRGAFANQYLATRGPGGSWSSHALNPPQGQTVFDAAGEAASVQLDLRTGFQGFSSGLCFALMIDWNVELLDPLAVPGYANLYRRDDCAPGADTYEALTRGADVLEPPLDSGLGPNPAIQARNQSADRSVTVFSAGAALTAEAGPAISGGGINQIYVRSPLGLRLLSKLPDGNTSLLNNMVGSGYPAHGSSLATAVSQDGSRVFWSTNSLEGISDPSGSVYLRLNPTEPDSALDGEGACTEPDKACTITLFEESGGLRGRFLAASADGSTATIAVGSLENADLYEVDVDRAISEGVSVAKTPIASEVGGLLGASRGLSYLYFTSKQALAAGATAGEWNLYLRHSGSVTFVATVDPIDRDAPAVSIDRLSPQLRHSRVSPDGRRLVFASIARLTGYDNTDPASGEAVSEVYRYDADTDKLACVSCNPSGARPAGQKRGGVLLPPVAAWLPGWEWSNYGSRTLSDDGSRVFFNAYDALVPADTNDAADVYEWEAPGSGNCTTDSPGYSPQNEGCLSLLSTGRGSEDSTFLDASADGGDLFFRTSSSISPADPGLIDIYDARVGGGEAPPPPSAPPCEGDACQSVPPAPSLPNLGSAALQGSGNVRAAAKGRRRCPKGKRRVRRKGRARCVKRHHRAKRHHRKHRRHRARRGRGRR